jgi:hypothetical protein
MLRLWDRRKSRFRLRVDVDSKSKSTKSWISRWLILPTIIASFTLASSPNAGAVVSNLTSLRTGCYHFTDKLLYDKANEVQSQSTFPDAYLGKALAKVNCTEPHHLEISSILKSKIINSLRMDSIPLRTKCIVGNIKLLSKTHSDHKAEFYFKVYRKPGSKTNLAFCGVIAPSFSHPNNNDYKVYEAFLSPHLNVETSGAK